MVISNKYKFEKKAVKKAQTAPKMVNHVKKSSYSFKRRKPASSSIVGVRDNKSSKLQTDNRNSGGEAETILEIRQDFKKNAASSNRFSKNNDLKSDISAITANANVTRPVQSKIASPLMSDINPLSFSEKIDNIDDSEVFHEDCSKIDCPASIFDDEILTNGGVAPNVTEQSEGRENFAPSSSILQEDLSQMATLFPKDH